MEQLPRDLVFKQTQHIVELATVWHYNASVPWLQATSLFKINASSPRRFTTIFTGISCRYPHNPSLPCFPVLLARK